MAAQPDKAAIRAQFLLDRFHIDIGQRRGQPEGRLFGVEHQARVGEQRRGIQAGRHQNAVSVDDIGAPGILFVFADAAGVAGFGIVREHRHVDHPDADHGERGRKQRSGDYKSVPTGFDSGLAIAFYANFLGRDLQFPDHCDFFSLARIGVSQSSLCG